MSWYYKGRSRQFGELAFAVDSMCTQTLLTRSYYPNRSPMDRYEWHI
jgi:hypothetical protein